MTGYTRKWDCKICGALQDTISWPKLFVCTDCLRPLASRLCVETLKAPLGPGIDEDYFMKRASAYAELLLSRGPRRVTITPNVRLKREQ